MQGQGLRALLEVRRCLQGMPSEVQAQVKPGLLFPSLPQWAVHIDATQV